MLKQMVLDRGSHVVVAVYTRHGKLIRIRRLMRVLRPRGSDDQETPPSAS